MDISDLLAREAVLPAAHACSRKELFHEIAVQASAAYGLDARLVRNALLERERQGSTAMGGGVAIPHAQLPGLTGVVGLFARLLRPVDFRAPDGRGVDLVFVLLAPEGWCPSRLCALAHICRLLHDRDLCSSLRGTAERPSLHALITASQRRQSELRAV